LLEVLDPEQNHNFYDNYLETEYDLSKVLFIATANAIQNMQPALRDRLEIVDLSGYAVEEKIQIARRHLVPKQKEAHGLSKMKFKIGDKVLSKIIEDYTRGKRRQGIGSTTRCCDASRSKGICHEEPHQKSTFASRRCENSRQAKV
jgi:ATP-dependent Lon protease